VGRERTVVNDLLAADADRIAGPFNIAVTIGHANALVRAGQPGVHLPRVEVRWDTTYVGGTYFQPTEGVAFINGRRGQDSDEYDDHVIAHEYGHFLMEAFSRESSPGGDHGFGERLDPRLAWSEGWGNFFAGATTGSPRYIDTGVVRGRQGVLVTVDIENDSPAGDKPGIWSEHSVASVLWDWFDDGAEEGDSVALGFAPLWQGFVELAKEPDVYLLRYAARAGPVSRGAALRRVRHRLGGQPRVAPQQRVGRVAALLVPAGARGPRFADDEDRLRAPGGERGPGPDPVRRRGRIRRPLRRGERRGRLRADLADAPRRLLPRGGARLEPPARLAAFRRQRARGHFYAARAVLTSFPRIHPAFSPP
jgi:hypothetical protein